MSGAMFRVKVIPDNGSAPYEVVAEARDVLLWERSGRDRAFADLTDRMRMVDIYSLMHVAAKRQGRFDGSLEMFENDVNLELLKPTEDDEAPDPTDRGR